MNEETLKRCHMCKIELPMSAFHVKASRCKACQKIYRRAWYLKNVDKQIFDAKRWRENNREKSNELKRIWGKANPRTKEQVHVSRLREYQRIYGDAWKLYYEYHELERALTRDPILSQIDSEKKRARKRRESGFFKTEYQRRKANGDYENRKRLHRDRTNLRKLAQKDTTS